MRRWAVVMSSLSLTCAAATTVAGTATAGERPDPRIVSGGMAGVVPARDAMGAANPHGGSSPNLLYHGGPVQTASTTVRPIYWGTSWGNSSFVGDKISGLDTFYGGVGGSSYMRTNIEYTNGAGAHVSSGVTKSANIIDTSAGPSRKAPSTGDVLAEVAKVLATNGGPVANAYYPVYVDAPRGHAGYCAWHSVGSINGVAVEFGFFFNLDGDPGCDPDNSSSTQSQGLEALANVSGHELSETVTDPQLNAWYDAKGAENSDKCAWTFGGNVSVGGASWKIQGNWSNSAYNANSGYTRGCIQTA
jgi:hypothetical protein